MKAVMLMLLLSVALASCATGNGSPAGANALTARQKREENAKKSYPQAPSHTHKYQEPHNN